MKKSLLLGLVAAFTLAGFAQAETQFIIKTDGTELNQEILDTLNEGNGSNLRFIRHSFANYYVVEDIVIPPEDSFSVDVLVNSLNKVSFIKSIRPEKKFVPHYTPSDSMFDSAQWYFKQGDYLTNNNGIDGKQLWDATTGDSSTVVAVIDTGILPTHYEFENVNVLPGADFISNTSMSNDGDGRDMDPSDAGDASGGYASSWHGTAVTSLIAANMNNHQMAGLTPNVSILPIRSLGVGGGTEVDIVEAMLWAAGDSVTGVSDNPYPAKVINMSLGAFDWDGVCDSYWQDVINYISDVKGVIVVAAAGNEQQDAAYSIPANCDNTITVAATNSDGDRAWFSNYGAKVTIAAPGQSILVAGNLGTSSPGENSTYYYDGTSFAAPIAASAIAAFIDYNPNILVGELKTLIQSTARPFNSASTCIGGFCGAGIIDPVAMILETEPNAFITNFPPVITATQNEFTINSDELFSIKDFISILDEEDGVMELSTVSVEYTNIDDYEFQSISISDSDIVFHAPFIIGDPAATTTFNVTLRATDSFAVDSDPVTLTVHVAPQLNQNPVVSNHSSLIYVLENNFIDVDMMATATDPDTHIDHIELIFETDIQLSAGSGSYYQAPEIINDQESVYFRIRFYDTHDGYTDSDLIEAIILKLDTVLNPPAPEPVVDETITGGTTEETTTDPVVTEEPVSTEPLPSTDPVITEPVTEEPVVVEEPVVIEEPVVEEPVVTEEPVIIEEPVIGELPVVEETPTDPIVEEEPVIVEEPVIEETDLPSEDVTDDGSLTESDPVDDGTSSEEIVVGGANGLLFLMLLSLVSLNRIRRDK